jgi:hypothetical protein
MLRQPATIKYKFNYIYKIFLILVYASFTNTKPNNIMTYSLSKQDLAKMNSSSDKEGDSQRSSQALAKLSSQETSKTYNTKSNININSEVKPALMKIDPKLIKQISDEFETTTEKAERILRQNNGDLTQSIKYILNAQTNVL